MPGAWVRRRPAKKGQRYRVEYRLGGRESSIKYAALAVWRVSAARTKTRRSRWIEVPVAVFDRVLELVPREDRDLESRVFVDSTADRLRTAIAKACKATGTPLFSPHDLRHRRASPWHLAGHSVAEAASWLGHSPQEHLRTYAHVVLDRREIDVENLLGRDRMVLASVLASLPGSSG